MSEEQAAILRDTYAAFSRADVDAVLARMAPDVTWRIGRRTLAGRVEVEELLTRLRASGWPAGDMAISDVATGDGRVVVRGTCGGRFEHRWTLRGAVFSGLEVA